MSPAKERGVHALRCLELWGGSLAADHFASVPGLDIHVLSTPYRGDQNGGDVYYVTQCGAGRIARLILADVAGHGAGVSAFSGVLKGLMRKHINTIDQTRFARALNDEFGEARTEGRFATAVLTTYFAPKRELVIVNAGHPPPLLRRASTGRWSTIEEAMSNSSRIRNLPLGVIEPTEYSQFVVSLEPEDTVVLYTDALIEAKNEQGEELGIDGLLRLAERVKPGGSVAPALRELVGEYRGDIADDDETIIELHQNAAPGPARSATDRLLTVGRMIGVGRIETTPERSD